MPNTTAPATGTTPAGTPIRLAACFAAIPKPAAIPANIRNFNRSSITQSSRPTASRRRVRPPHQQDDTPTRQKVPPQRGGRRITPRRRVARAAIVWPLAAAQAAVSVSRLLPRCGRTGPSFCLGTSAIKAASNIQGACPLRPGRHQMRRPGRPFFERITKDCVTRRTSARSSHTRRSRPRRRLHGVAPNDGSRAVRTRPDRITYPIVDHPSRNRAWRAQSFGNVPRSFTRVLGRRPRRHQSLNPHRTTRRTARRAPFGPRVSR